MNYLYFPGCKISGYLPQYDMATRAVLKALGVDLIDVELNCCGYPVRHRSLEASVYSSIRILAAASERRVAVLTPCKCCYGNLMHAKYWMAENKELRDYVETLLAGDRLRYDDGVRVVHLLSVLDGDVGISALQSAVVQPLNGLSVAAHYGCHALRPANVVALDDPLSPTLFERLVSVTGADAVDWRLRLDCCGAPLWEKNNAAALRLMNRKIADAQESGADILCTACTYCQHQFDAVQAGTKESRPSDENPLPSVLYPQLLGLAMGIDPRRLGLDKNYIQWDF